MKTKTRNGLSVEREDIVRVLEARGDKRAKRFDECCQNVIRLECVQNPGTFNDHGYALRQTCNIRICPHCASLQGDRVYRKYADAIKVLARHGKPGHSLYFLTATLRVNADEELGKRLRRLKDNFTKLLRRFYKSPGCFGLYVTEIGSSNGMAHVHAVVQGPRVSADRLKNAWREITGDSYIVDIEPVVFEREKTLEKAVRYILKYVGKVPEMDTAEEYVDYLEAIDGTRRLDVWGKTLKEFKATKTACGCRKCGAKVVFSSVTKDFAVKNGRLIPSEEFSIKLRHALELLGLEGETP